MGNIGADPKRVEILPANPVLPSRAEPAPSSPAPARQPDEVPAR